MPSVYNHRYSNTTIEIVIGGNHLPTSLDKPQLLEYSNTPFIPFAKLGSKVVEIYLDYELIKTHLRGDRGRRVTDWNDYPREKAAFFQRTPEWYRHKASLIYC